MTDIFVSYAHEDKARIEPLINLLEEFGWSVWWDTKIQTGVLFDMEIESALNAARCVLVVWSKHSVDSQWVRSEAHEGMDRNILVPILIDDVRPPMPFKQIQAVDYVIQPLDLPLSKTGLDVDIKRAFSGEAGLFHLSQLSVASDESKSIGRWLRPVLLFGLFTILLFTFWPQLTSISTIADKSVGPQSASIKLSSESEKQIRVIIAKVQNLTGDEIFDDSLDQALKIGLGQSRSATVLSDTELRRTLTRMKLPPDTVLSREVAIEVAVRERARAVIIASITRVGEAYSIAIEVVNPSNGQTIFTNTAESSSREKIVGSLGEATKVLRAQLGETLASIDDNNVQLEKVTTTNLEALKAYSTAINRAAQDDLGDPIQLMLLAIDRDPEFAMAHAKLGTLYSVTNDELDKAEMHWALALKYGDRLTEREKVYIQASVTWKEKPADRIRAWSLMSSLFPEDVVGHHNLGMVYWQDENLFPQAADALRRAVAIDHPWSYVSMHTLGYVLLGLGQSEEALHWFEMGLAQESNPLDYGIADVLIVMRRYDEAITHLRSGATVRVSPAALQRDRKLVGFYADQGRLKAASEVAQRQLAQARNIGLPAEQYRSTAALLAVLERLEEPDKFQQILVELADVESGNLDQKFHDLSFSWIPALALAGKISARNGNIDLAQQILAQVQPLANKSGYFFWEAYTGLLQAEIYLAQSDSGSAIRKSQEVLDGGQLFQAHETLARAYEASGDSRSAIDEYLWLSEQRGLAFAENLSGSYGKEFNVLDWVFAHYHLGRLYASVGDSNNASLHYLAFIDHWQSADKPNAALTRAYEYLASL